MFEQLSLFSLTPATEAIFCFDNSVVSVQPPEPWMLKLEPRGEYLTYVGKHPRVLTPSSLRAKDIEACQKHGYYLIDGMVYGSTFVS